MIFFCDGWKNGAQLALPSEVILRTFEPSGEQVGDASMRDSLAC
jgi:hypothetical protein